MLNTFIFIPFIIQMLVISFDEYFFHIKRGLPRWERIGHPLDTLSVLLCFLFVLLVPFSEEALKWYIGLALFSCIFVTKDEFVHKHHCPASEQWLHAFLFLNHPVLLASLGLMWGALQQATAPQWLQSLLAPSDFFLPFLFLQTAFASLFFLYQIIFWNFLWKETRK